MAKDIMKLYSAWYPHRSGLLSPSAVSKFKGYPERGPEMEVIWK